MKRRVILALACAFVAVPAAAQTTRCGWEFGKWVCRTEQPPQQPDIVGAGAAGYAATDAMIQDMRRHRAQALAVPLSRRVADAMMAGRCDEARKIALDGGSPDLADQAKRNCVPN